MKGEVYKDPQRLDLIKRLMKEDRPVWKRVARELSRSRKNRAEVNLSSINKLTKPDDIVLVPGKVLGEGSLDHAITLAYYRISSGALQKVQAAKGTAMRIEDLLRENPRGKDIKIIK